MKTVLQHERGVTLTKVELMSDDGVAATAYEISSTRTAETWDTTSAVQAQVLFEEELARVPK